MNSHALVAMLLLASTPFLAGCTNCDPAEVPTQVALTLAEEEVRQLPVLTSGRTQIAGVAIPDSHGRLEVDVTIGHVGNTNASLNFTTIDIQSLQLHVDVEGRPLPIHLVGIDGGSRWAQRGANLWDGAAVDGSHLTLWWTVDRDRLDTPTKMLLARGAAYNVAVEFDWRHESCTARAAGHLRQTFTDFVEDIIDAQNFRTESAPSLDVTTGDIGIRANYTIESGLDVRVTGVKARAVFFAVGDVHGRADGAASIGDTKADITADIAVQVPTVGLVTWPNLAAVVDGEAASIVTPRDRLTIQSASPSQTHYAASGILLPPTIAPQGGLWVVTIVIEYSPTDATVGTGQDTFTYGIVA